MMQFLLPGPFVVMQGMLGDGMKNTIDSMPVFEEDDSSTLESSQNRIDDDSKLEERLESAIEPKTSRSSRYKPLSIAQVEAVEQWRMDCRERETNSENDIFTPCNPQTAGKQCTVSNRQSWWSTTMGELIIFDTLPTLDQQNLHVGKTVSQLPPGVTVWGEELIFLDSNQFIILNRIEEIREPWESSSIGVKGTCIFVRISSPCAGYILFNFDGYYFCGFGDPTNYIRPDYWLWRVTYLPGAYVRDGLELDSAHVGTVPFGATVRVTRKTVNSMGLTRLSVESINHSEHSRQSTLEVEERGLKPHTRLAGWVSEFLNPLSGKRGPILQSLSFPVPALYRVRIQLGAIIRAGVELSSQEIGHAPFGSILSIVGRSYSEHPRDKCIDRLKLAGNAGWISLRLNRHPPHDEMVVEMISIDSSFDPYHPELYHLEKQEQTWTSQNRGIEKVSADRNLLDVTLSQDSVVKRTSDDIQPYYFPILNCAKCSSQNSNRSNKFKSEEKCLICLSDDRTATIVHGETGHIACCLACARILKARGDKCPVCRLPIDLVIQHFVA